jgi:excisionase family DNA binding protein
MATRTRANTADAAKPHRPQRRPRTVEARQRGTPPSAAEITSAVHRALESVPASVRTEFVEAVADQTAEALDESLWGAGPSAAELRSAALQGLKDDFIARRDLLSASLSRSEVAELLGVSSQAVLDRLADGDLVGLKDGREWRIPMWQVNAGAERGFLPGIAELRRVFPGGVVSLSRWATTSNVELGGMAPADALAAGRVQEVIAVAATATAAAW